ncbi:hypothetical protein COV12_02640 [Candidatus Woesearchaeota archaeon CG10_big_fil_rev_8_21_14_0_10_32_24]|nr:MAG: hypothetical protein COV12_02640 [Candidatus Woesearchaeota archaeon CG10_big_fil_rev_8_21_14_0_10_32_24]
MVKEDVAKFKFYSILAISLIVVSLFLTLDGEQNLTGATIYIQTQPYLDDLQQISPEKIQTFISVKQPTLKTLKTTLGVKSFAGEIADELNFPREIVKMYEQNPPYKILSDSLFAVELAASEEDTNFRNELTCLTKIGANKYGHWKYSMNIFSELKFQKCPNSQKTVGFMKHTFYEDNNDFLCSQDNKGLFTIDLNSGLIEKGVHC